MNEWEGISRTVEKQVDFASGQCTTPNTLSVKQFWTHTVLVEEVKAKTTELLNGLTEKDLHHCSEQYRCHMQLCLLSEGDYFESDHKSFFDLCSK
jgi:hypothetical protein